MYTKIFFMISPSNILYSLAHVETGDVLRVSLHLEQRILDVREEGPHLAVLAAGVDQPRGKLITGLLEGHAGHVLGVALVHLLRGEAVVLVLVPQPGERKT